MKKITTLALLITLSIVKISAQTLDTLTMGAGYSVQTWYKFETDKETKSPINNWDLAFTARKLDAAIWVNPNAALYKAVAPASAWLTMTVDTLALTQIQTNTDTSLFVGAMNRTQDGVFDYGWGNYNVASHNVTGDSVYIIKSITDGKWHKLFIERLALDTSFFVRIADLNGANQSTFEVKKGTYAGKNFGYYSFAANAQSDREPLAKDWDVLVSRHWGLTPDANGVYQSYLLTGILQNNGVSIAKVTKRDTINDSYTGQVFKPITNVIGADWKTFNLNTSTWKVADSTVYFVKTPITGKIYKLVFTGFGGSGTGNCIFTREVVGQATSVKLADDKIAALAVSPNPATDGNFTIIYDFGKTPQSANFQLFNLAGQAVYSQKLQNTEGVQTLQMPQLNLPNGVYLARLTFDGQSLVRKIVIQ